jgi:hypothetical protein
MSYAAPSDPNQPRWYSVYLQNTFGSAAYNYQPDPQFAGWFWTKPSLVPTLQSLWSRPDVMTNLVPFG